MNKRLLIAVVCIITALVISAGSIVYISVKTKEIVGYLEAAVQKHENGEDISYDTEKALVVWDEVKQRFGIMIKHVDADELERNFIKIADYLESGNNDELFVTVCECKAALEVMLDGELPKCENIF